MNIISFVARFLLPSVEDDTELVENMNNLIWELIFPLKDEKSNPESTYSVLKSVSIENGPFDTISIFHDSLKKAKDHLR